MPHLPAVQDLGRLLPSGQWRHDVLASATALGAGLVFSGCRSNARAPERRTGPEPPPTGATGAKAAQPEAHADAGAPVNAAALATRAIPSTGEAVPVIGAGTSSSRRSGRPRCAGSRRTREKLDFVQINDAVSAPEAARTVFPVAQQLGVAVMINRAFDDGRLFARVEGRAPPGWAGEVGVTSWAQMFLKFALSHLAVTVVIPATGKPHRQADNLRAGTGPLLDDKQQKELVASFS